MKKSDGRVKVKRIGFHNQIVFPIHKNARDGVLKNKYGISLDEYNQMLEDQKESCAICKTPQSLLKKKLCIDHCHVSKKVRGLLCGSCNIGLSRFKDDKDLLKNAIEYLLRK